MGSEKRFRAVVVTPRRGDHNLFQRMNEAFSNDAFCAEIGRLVGREIDAHLSDFAVDEVFSDREKYGEVVRELCMADVAAFDITKYHCGVMLLLGIRSVVRRGVTLSAAADDDLDFMPFNLRALRPVPCGGAAKDVARRLRTTMREGFARRGELPESYQDLPAFQDVRLLGASRGSYTPVQPTEEVLVLQSYNRKYYGEDGGDSVESAINTVFGDGTALRIVDSRSPQLAEQRLYAAIRRNKLCVADWTGGRPNVFFEVGVRLAVNPVDPLHLLAKDYQHPDTSPDSGLEELTKLIEPRQLALKDTGPLIGILKEYRAAQEQSDDYPREGGMLETAHTFDIVKDTVALDEIGSTEPVYFQLRREAMSLVGDDPIGDGTMPAIYSESSRVARRYRELAVERLSAAWDHLLAEARRSKEDGDAAHLGTLVHDADDLATFYRDTLRTLRGERYRELERRLNHDRRTLGEWRPNDDE